ncbi:MAG TPA: PP2C family serine/threonine-protein phosphatase [Thermoanaerobaculia bacterium]|jgi:protein phosphatase|nr:PP2C family serine/threonine-protein phosphatase [Thermoanaerobaculia bacterium]
MSSILACGQTDPGLARLHNEDAFRVDGDNGLYVVADGMGGHSHGEVASKIAVETIARTLRAPEPARATPIPLPTRAAVSSNQNTPLPHNPAAATQPGAGLRPHSLRFRDAIRRAHDAMLNAIRDDLSLQGMGTTVAGLLVRDGIAAVAHVGDSRVYRLRGSEMRLLTRDHTWVNEQVMAGFLTEDQARTHPLRNVVTRALGGEAEVAVDVSEVELRKGDLYLICSDGLTTMLTDPDIKSRLASGKPLDEICRSLIAAANERGGVDNITVVIARVQDDSQA